MTAPGPGPVAGPLPAVAEVGMEVEAAQAVVPTAAVLATLLASLAAVHRLVLRSDLGGPTDVLLLASAAVAAAVAVLGRRGRIGSRSTYPVLALLLALTLAAASTHLLASREPAELASYLFILGWLGAVALRRSWFVAGVVAVWVVWAGTVHVLGVVPWAPTAFNMLSATALAATVHVLRRRGITTAVSAVQRAVAAATQDASTGLANRRGLALLTDDLLGRARREGDTVHCCFLDVDGLKAVNDELGHDAGDRVILAVAEAIRASCRVDDIVARWGGDEFVVVGRGIGRDPERLHASVQSQLEASHPHDPMLRGVRISTGYSRLGPYDEGDAETLLWRADHDMYLRRTDRLDQPVFRPGTTSPSTA